MLLGLLKTLRPRQWFKNVFVLAPVVFAKNLFLPEVLLRAVAGFLTFSLLAGAVYIINDLADIEADRNHPTKKFRPIPSGGVPLNAARGAAVVLVAVALGGGFALDVGVGLCALAYLINNLAYSFWIKHVPYLDVSSISAGFVLRVVAGCYAVSTAAHPVRPSLYIILCTALLSLFQALGKRRHELKVNAAKGRRSLEGYNEKTLTAVLYLVGVATVISYVLYTLDPTTAAFFHTRYLWLTTPFVLVGMGMFIQLVRDEKRLESPTDSMIRNVPFVLNLVAYAATIIMVVYRLRPSGQ